MEKNTRLSIRKRILSLIVMGFFASVNFLPAFSAELPQELVTGSGTEKISSVNFLGMKKSRTAKILDDFKEAEKTLLFENAPFTKEEEFGLFDADSRIRNLEEISRRIQESKNSLKEQKSAVTVRKYTLKSMLDSV